MALFGSKEKGIGAKCVSIATLQYRPPCVFLKVIRQNNSAKFQSPLSTILSKDINDVVICLHAVTTYDVIIFLFPKYKNLNISGT